MHISEGVLSPAVLSGGGALAAAATAWGLKKLPHERIAQAGVLSAAFFVVCLIHVPIGPSAVHLTLNGLVGLVMGWAAFPVILIGLLLQAVFFQIGGLTTLGVNTVVMAFAAVVCRYVFGRWIFAKKNSAVLTGFLCGAFSVLLSAVLMAAALQISDPHFFKLALTALAVHVPIALVEGVVTAFVVGFLTRVRPELLLADQKGI